MTAMAASLFLESALISVEVIRVGEWWHRRARMGAFGYWRPDGCKRDGDIIETRRDLPRTEAVCRVCWPVWPKLAGR